MLVRKSLVKNKTVMHQPPYSSDLVHDDFFIFSKLSTPIKANRFATIEEKEEKLKQKLLAIPKSAFQKCFEDCKNTLA